MDLFFDGAPVHSGRKQRVHFHSFMRDVIRHLHLLGEKSSESQRLRYDSNMLRPLAKSIARQSYLLCFDEIQVPDPVTAAIIQRLFTHLAEYGVIIVSTSNRAP